MAGIIPRAAFLLPAVTEEPDLRVGHELRAWTVSATRSKKDVACAFLRGCYPGWAGGAPAPYTVRVERPGGEVFVAFGNVDDARLLVNRAYNCGGELIVFTRVTAYTNYMGGFGDPWKAVHQLEHGDEEEVASSKTMVVEEDDEI